jgi:hypothetical protein
MVLGTGASQLPWKPHRCLTLFGVKEAERVTAAVAAATRQRDVGLQPVEASAVRTDEQVCSVILALAAAVAAAWEVPSKERQAVAAPRCSPACSERTATMTPLMVPMNGCRVRGWWPCGCPAAFAVQAQICCSAAAAVEESVVAVVAAAAAAEVEMAVEAAVAQVGRRCEC